MGVDAWVRVGLVLFWSLQHAPLQIHLDAPQGGLQVSVGAEI